MALSGAETRTPQEELLCSASLRAHLLDIDGKVAALHARLRDLATTRKSVVDALKSIVYPILTIPPEITAEIFMHYVDVASTGTHRRRSPGQPGVLASVCRAWRNIALKLQEIWSRIKIDTYRKLNVADVEKLLRCWLQRAGTHMLDLDLDPSIGLHSPAAPIFSIIAPVSLHWKNIVLCTLDQEVLALLPSLCGLVPALEALTLRIPKRDSSTPPRMPITAFLEAPKLRELHINYITPEWFSLPWAQLTTLSLFSQRETDCISILQQTPHLEVLSLDYIISLAGVSLPTVQLKRLHTLKIIQQLLGWDLDFLDALTVPALQNIVITMDPETLEDEENVSFWCLDSLVQRSKCSPTSVVLINVDTHLAVEILASTPTATEITVEWFHLKERPEGRLFDWIAKNPEFLPQLKKLRVQSEEPDYNVPYEELARMLNMRAHAGASATSDSSASSPTALQQLEFTAKVTHGLSTRSEGALHAVEQRLRAHQSNCKIQIKGPHSLHIEPGPTQRSQL